MFDSLSDRLGATLDGLRGQGRLTEDDINRAMREMACAARGRRRLRRIREFVAAVKERAARGRRPAEPD
jgi:signal recognition particle subunit SRP54